MYLCDLIEIDEMCSTCPFKDYGDCEFTYFSSLKKELSDIIARAEFAKEAMRLLEG